MSWTTIDFGKHTGKTLPQVLFSDPDWFFWAVEKGVFDSRPMLRREASVLHAKATSIRVPQNGSEKLAVEYNFHPTGGKSVGFELVPEKRAPHSGSTITIRMPYIDLSMARRAAQYDKLGYRLFVRCLKSYSFGDADLVMTKRRCEEFFDDSSRFHNNT